MRKFIITGALAGVLAVATVRTLSGAWSADQRCLTAIGRCG
jgi:hypothetical protein